MGIQNQYNQLELVTKNLKKSFGGLKALDLDEVRDGVNIEVEKGSITLVIGPNGSGKSTLINNITGFLNADSGKVLYKGKEITNLPASKIFKKKIVRTFQTSHPLKKLTVLENLLIAAPDYGDGVFKSLSGNWKEKEEAIINKAFEYLIFLGLDHLWDNEAQDLSGGQLRLLEIGRVLMSEARLIIMDEPIAGVAPELAHNILKKLRKLTDKGFSFLIVEHRLDIILEYVDSIYVLANGRIIAKGNGNEILENPKVIEVYLGAQG
jgi:branched-chain amino acid transport system ATP-binding protein|tara:strand:+ start:2544 stop:3338 length:795 start_codon:yes stop_codon:yes gene_type:complete